MLWLQGRPDGIAPSFCCSCNTAHSAARISSSKPPHPARSCQHLSDLSAPATCPLRPRLCSMLQEKQLPALYKTTSMLFEWHWFASCTAAGTSEVGAGHVQCPDMACQAMRSGPAVPLMLSRFRPAISGFSHEDSWCRACFAQADLS